MGFLAMLLLMAVMFYLPFAQVRYAFTEDWRSFFDFRFIHVLLCSSPLSLLLLAIVYAISSIVLTIIKMLPVFLPAINPQFDSFSTSEALQFLNDYYFFTGLLSVLLLFILKTLAGRIYARLLIKIWSQKHLPIEFFHSQEILLLNLLNISFVCSMVMNSAIVI